MASAVGTRIGGHVVVDSLRACGAEAVFGLPGIHALAIWEGMRSGGGDLTYVGHRTELAAGFAADGYARSTGRTATLLTTTGPGSFVAACALMEAKSSYVPLVNIVSQIPRAIIDQDRGFLHELPRQTDVFRPLTKAVLRAQSAESLPHVLAQAYRLAATAPQGPVMVEVPVDVLEGATNVTVPDALDAAPATPQAAPDGAVARAAELLAGADRPVLWAGGGVLRAGAQAELRALAERLDAPVCTTYMGRGALPDSHPLAVGAGCDETAFQELLRDADVVLAVGTELGAETTGQWGLELHGELIHLDVRAEHIGRTYTTAVGLAGDARPTLAALGQAVPAAQRDGAARAAAVRERIAQGLAAMGMDTERELLQTIRAAIPPEGVTTFDMTILGYWAAPHLPVERGGSFLYPLGSGTLGYAWPAALGAKVGHPDAPVVAVHGDGGFLYATQELATARQHGIAAKLVLVDDHAYGILKVYQSGAYEATHAVDLVQPDFEALAGAYGVPVFPCEADGFAEALDRALAVDGPAVTLLRHPLRVAQVTP